MAAFLSIITRTYRRPRMLQRLRDTLEEQTDRDFDHTIIHDLVGIGIDKANVRLRTVDVRGKYVAVIDDDVEVADPDFVAKLKPHAGADVIVVELNRMGTILPNDWPPRLAHIDGANFVVSREVWNQCRENWGERYEGDWDFISSVMATNPRIERVEGVMLNTQRISKGAPE